MNDLVEFLRARYDEDEAAARESIPALSCEDGMPMWPDYQTYSGGDLIIANNYLDRFQPARVLAEVDSKRRQVELHIAEPGQHPDFCWHDREEFPCTTLRLLALPYADHPSYDEAWRP